jgi:hypothetical protein
MLRLEDFIEITEPASRRVERKRDRAETGCGPEYAAQVPEAGPPSEYEPKSWKVDQHRAYLREHWERGVRNPSRLFELQKPE